MHQNPGIHLDGEIEEDGKWKARWEKLVYFITQCYDVPYSRVRKMVISTPTAELDGIRGCKWNAERVIIFQTVTLQHVQLVTGTKHICAIIDDRLDSWNSGEFDELICDSYAAAMGYLGRAHWN